MRKRPMILRSLRIVATPYLETLQHSATHCKTHRHPVDMCNIQTSISPSSTYREFGMGWLQSVASTKFEVSFAEYRLFYRALLQKRPIILRSLLVVATPDAGAICILMSAFAEARSLFHVAGCCSMLHCVVACCSVL